MGPPPWELIILGQKDADTIGTRRNENLYRIARVPHDTLVSRPARRRTRVGSAIEQWLEWSPSRLQGYLAG